MQYLKDKPVSAFQVYKMEGYLLIVCTILVHFKDLIFFFLGLPISSSLFRNRKTFADNDKCVALSNIDGSLGLVPSSCLEKKPFICQYGKQTIIIHLQDYIRIYFA